MLARRSFLAGLAGLWAGAAVRPSSAQPVHPLGKLDIHYGWDADIAGPTEADFHVAIDGDDRGDGSIAQPVRTIQRGIDLLATRAGGSLAIHGGTYREAVSLDGLRGTAEAPYRIHRYGRDRVTITAAEKLTGWAPCPEDEAEALGISGPGVFVTRFPASDIGHGSIHALNLHEAGTWCSLAVDRADRSNPEVGGDQTTYHRGIFHVDDDNHILSVEDPRLKGIAVSAMLNAKLLIYHFPNVVSAREIGGFDPIKGKITLAERGPKAQGKGTGIRPLYAIRGAGWALIKGSWIARENSAGEVSVYFRPVDPASLAQDIEVSLRPTCIDIGGGRHVELFGIEAIRAAGADRRSGICIRALRDKRRPDDGKALRLIHCRIGESFSAGGGYGALFLGGVKSPVLRNVSTVSTRGNFGIFLMGCSDVDMRFLHITNASGSPARFYSMIRGILAFSLFENSASGAHSNKFNFYEGCDSILVYGVRCRNVGGYATYQEASRIHYAFCDIPCNPRANNRALVSQNRAPGAKQGGPDDSGDPVVGGTFYYWNNSLVPDPRHAKEANALALGPEKSSQHHAFFNNMLHGGGVASVYTKTANPKREIRSHNRYTGFSWWQTAKYGWRLGPNEEAMRLGQLPRGTGLDMRPLIRSEIAPLFPTFSDWDFDIDGQPVDWENPPIGCRV